jgi:uncharacterized protein YdeI (YjbR/CyaY-like superfamily)
MDRPDNMKSEYSDPINAPVFFETAAAFRRWLDQYAASKTELVVGFYKVGSGKSSMSWSESVDEALCVGWIDGVRRRIDDIAYQIRFTPRQAASIWSAVNIEKMRLLQEHGRVGEAGRQAYARRTENRSAIYAHEQATPATLSADDERQFRSQPAAWTFFEAQPAWYRHQVAYRIANAKRPETKARRLMQYIEASQKAVRI